MTPVTLPHIIILAAILIAFLIAEFTSTRL